jgi:hypothetical protein
MTNSDDPETTWHPFWGEILEIPTDGSGQIRRLVHHRTRSVPGRSTKYWQPDFVVNRQGTKIIYRSVYLSRNGDIFMFDVGDRYKTKPDTIRPEPPTGLRNPIKTSDQLELVWDAPIQAPDGDTAVAYKIFRNDVFLGDCSDTYFRDVGLNEATTYQYNIYSVDHSGLSCLTPASALFSTLSDTIGPTLCYIHIENQDKIILFFSEPIDILSAQNVNHYSFDQDAQVIQATRGSDPATVVLQTIMLKRGVSYHLRVHDITDVSAKKNLISSGTLKTITLYDDFFDNFENGLPIGLSFINPARWTFVMDEGDQSLYISARDSENNGDDLDEYTLFNSDKLNTTTFKMKTLVKSFTNINVNSNTDYALIFGFIDGQNYNCVQFFPKEIQWIRIEEGVKTIIKRTPFTLLLDRYQEVEVQLQQDTLRAFVDEKKAVESPCQLSLPGLLGLGSCSGSIYFDNVMIDIPAADHVAPVPPTGLELLLITK